MTKVLVVEGKRFLLDFQERKVMLPDGDAKLLSVHQSSSREGKSWVTVSRGDRVVSWSIIGKIEELEDE